ncbi:MAG: bifunctional UDP-N-acetylglucosamine diphosphorylase/glucosamine-1-phosphate N-acetyltransferase GlmU [Thermoleophilaceae bacterium]|nr:bifunctional UDP-N-acetylglucosamine diphosphorylase/glucosamine-1-phosphate N-acetyltransferase GlmU [Thermoleophilaceae bacterium]
MPAGPTVLIMAAGHGTRMRSSLPKVLHPVCGRPMLLWVAEAARGAGAQRVVAITRPGEGVAEHLPDEIENASQTDGEGTGNAVLAARDAIEREATVLVLSGDHPLVSPQLIAALVETHERESAHATLLTTSALDPAGYGRIVRGDDGAVERIVETKHTGGVAPEELAIREINIGAYAFSGGALLDALERVTEEQGERYLTAAFPLIREAGGLIAGHETEDASSAMGVNTRADLMEIERHARRALLEEHARGGVSFPNPDTVTIDAGVEIGEDTVIEPGTTLRGATVIGTGSTIGPATTVENSEIGEGVTVLHSYLTHCVVGNGASIGPFAYLRPKADIGEGAKIGTYVEVKNSEIGAGAKIPHLSYIGDAEVGEGANVAAGNITANYDAREKHRTKIGAGVKTGVNTSFVAPVTVGEGAYIGAGSVIVDDVPPGALGIARPKQKNVEGYADHVERRPR